MSVSSSSGSEVNFALCSNVLLMNFTVLFDTETGSWLSVEISCSSFDCTVGMWQQKFGHIILICICAVVCMFLVCAQIFVLFKFALLADSCVSAVV